MKRTHAHQSKANPTPTAREVVKHKSKPLCEDGAETLSLSRVLSSEDVGKHF